MLAVLAVICFVLALFDVSLGDNATLPLLGLTFLAAHEVFPFPVRKS